MLLISNCIIKIKRAYEIKNIRKKVIPNLGANNLGCSKSISKKMLKLGFSPDCYYLYDLKKNNYKDYITEIERFLIRDKINNGFNSLVTNKSLFYDVISRMANTPKLYFRVINGNLFDEQYNLLNKDSFLDIVSSCGYNRFFIKPTYGFRGRNASIVTINPYSINGNFCQKEELFTFLCFYQDCVVVETIKNSDYGYRIAPNSLNTIRILTFKPDSGNPEIAFAVHRFGGGGIVDNASDSSSVFAQVDLETGILGIAKSHYSLNQFERHPITNEPIKGVVVTNFKLAKNIVVNLHKKMPFFDILAWDVAICDDGPYIIEANAMSDVDFVQAVCGGLRKSNFGKFVQNKLKL